MTPRYEFRAWNGVTDAAGALRDAADRTSSETARDCYVLAPTPDVNAKIRNRSLDVKHLIGRRGDLERWKPGWSREAPFSAESVDRLFDDIGHPRPPAGDSGLDVDALIGLLRSRLDAAWVTKHRTHHRVGPVLAEQTDIEIERTAEVLHCIAIESEDPEAVNELRNTIGLGDADNVPVHLAVASAMEG